MFWGVVTLKGPEEVWSHSSVKRAEPIPDWNDYDIPLVSMTAGCLTREWLGVLCRR